MKSSPGSGTLGKALLNRCRFRFLGLTPGQMVKYFFGGNALVAVIVLALITVFLFREGAGFFTLNAKNIRLYRRAGLEYVDFIRRQVDEHTALNRALNELRLAQFTRLTASGRSVEEANEALEKFGAFAEAYSDAADDVRGVLSDLTDAAMAIKEREQVNDNRFDFGREIAQLKAAFPTYREANQKFAASLEAALVLAPQLTDARLEAKMEAVKVKTRAFIHTFPKIELDMAAWRWDKPILFARSVASFLFGREWLTASFWQDWYGLVPLFCGSLLVSAIALSLAVPLGVAAAIHVSEIAGAREKNLVKPAIEFISAIPSVVLGFFGIAVLGTALRGLSQVQWLAWVPGFPMSERLNALTAGCLLAFMAVPTIFSLSEDALNNVPRHLKEASYALGANRLQTIVRVLLPASLSGIVSAILLGFGRVIGETMVVLLCAGNRIAIPDFTEGLGALFQPVHTMTGIIAQEMGEVVAGSIHYRALFMVGVMLFFLSMLINYLAQRIVQRYRISIG